MQSSPDWGALFVKGRCKAVGVPWSDVELNAIHKLGVPYEYVRLGCLTQEEYSKMKNEMEAVERTTGEKPLKILKKEELVQKAVALGISVDADKVTRNDLIAIIEQAIEKQAQH